MRNYDMDYESPSYSIATSDDSYEAAVKRVHPKAYIKKTETKHMRSFKVRVKTGWFSSIGIGRSHLFKDQCWESAYKCLVQNGTIKV